MSTADLDNCTNTFSAINKGPKYMFLLHFFFMYIFSNKNDDLYVYHQKET